MRSYLTTHAMKGAAIGASSFGREQKEENANVARCRLCQLFSPNQYSNKFLFSLLTLLNLHLQTEKD